MKMFQFQATMKGALYLYYTSKDAIITALLKYFFTQEFKQLQMFVESDQQTTVQDQLIALTRQLVSAMKRMATLMPIAFEFYAIAGRNKEARQFLKEYYQQYCRKLARLIQRGIERNEFRVVDAEATATTLAVFYEGLSLLLFVDPQAPQWPEQTETAVLLLLEGIKQRSPHLNPNVVLFLFLPALLFEGAWNVQIERLRADWLVILLLAVPGLLISLLIVAALLHVFLGISWGISLLVGAIISPTDPVAVLALLRQLGLPERLRTIVEGESLFNDGVGAAVFELVLGLVLASLGTAERVPSSSSWIVVLEVLWLMLGGLVLGIGTSLLVARLLRLVDDHLIEMAVTVSVAYGMYLLGGAIHTSGLLAVVGAGLVLGSYGRRTGMSERTREATHAVWEFLSYLANSLLFLLLGVQIGESRLVLTVGGIGLALVGVIIGRATMIYTLVPLHNLFARWMTRTKIAGWFSWLPHSKPLPSHWRPILLFSGLRGALSIALVLSLPETLQERGLLENIVYGVVLVTLLGQGIGLHLLLPRWNKDAHEEVSKP